MLLGNKRLARIAAAVLIGVVVIALALSLVSTALAAQAGDASLAAASGPAPRAGETPTPSEPSMLGSSSDPKPVTKTPQGTSTQVSDKEHLGGLVAFLVLMAGGGLLLLRARRRERRESAGVAGSDGGAGRAPRSILSRP